VPQHGSLPPAFSRACRAGRRADGLACRPSLVGAVSTGGSKPYAHRDGDERSHGERRKPDERATRVDRTANAESRTSERRAQRSADQGDWGGVGDVGVGGAFGVGAGGVGGAFGVGAGGLGWGAAVEPGTGALDGGAGITGNWKGMPVSGASFKAGS